MKPRQELEATHHINSQEQREKWMCACLKGLAHFFYSYTIQDPAPENDAAHSGLCLPISINQENPPEKIPKVNPIQKNPSLRLSPSDPTSGQVDE